MSHIHNDTLDDRHLLYALNKYFDGGYKPKPWMVVHPGFEEWRAGTVFSDKYLRMLFKNPLDIDWDEIYLLYRNYEFATKYEGWSVDFTLTCVNAMRKMLGMPELAILQSQEEALLNVLRFIGINKNKIASQELFVLCREKYPPALRLAAYFFEHGLLGLRKSDYLAYTYRTLADDIENKPSEDDLLRLHYQFF